MDGKVVATVEGRTACPVAIFLVNMCMRHGKHIVARTRKTSVTSFSKDQHGLRLRDIDHKDKQNFEAIMRITYPSFLCLLQMQKVHLNC